jgi:RNA polymerase sporulation-specific sigma factor
MDYDICGIRSMVFLSDYVMISTDMTKWGMRSRPHLAAVDDVSDEDLVERYQHGDTTAMEILLARYRDFPRAKARSYYLVGADRDDLIQEGLIGLYKAVRDYQRGNNATFRTFADVCITRQILTAVKTATRHKHGPLNSGISLATPMSVSDDPDRVLADVLEAPRSSSDPAELVISNEGVSSIKVAFIGSLSRFEAEVLSLYLGGISYQEIGERLSRHVKAIDNALQRIKKKLELHIRTRDADDQNDLVSPSSN